MGMKLPMRNIRFLFCWEQKASQSEHKNVLKTAPSNHQRPNLKLVGKERCRWLNPETSGERGGMCDVCIPEGVIPNTQTHPNCHPNMHGPTARQTVPTVSVVTLQGEPCNPSAEQAKPNGSGVEIWLLGRLRKL